MKLKYLQYCDKLLILNRSRMFKTNIYTLSIILLFLKFIIIKLLLLLLRCDSWKFTLLVYCIDILYLILIRLSHFNTSLTITISPVTLLYCTVLKSKVIFVQGQGKLQLCYRRLIHKIRMIIGFFPLTWKLPYQIFSYWISSVSKRLQFKNNWLCGQRSSCGTQDPNQSW